MPPQISDDELSDVSEKKGKLEQKESLQVESEKDEEDEEDEDDDDEEPGEDEFVVEAITSHLVDEDTGEIRYEVKWEGYDKKSERTWEPEENLETAPEILNNYLAKIGGKELIMDQWREKKAAAGKAAAEKKGKKRARASTGTNGAAKKGRVSGSYPDGATPPAGAKGAAFKPPTGSWEDEVAAVDAAEGTDGTIRIYLTWKHGERTQHPKEQVYRRCPQKMLQFYESHLIFKKPDAEADADADA